MRFLLHLFLLPFCLQFLYESFKGFTHEAALVNIVGATNPPRPGTLFDKHGVKVAQFSAEEHKKIEQMCSPESKPEPWAQWRERLNGWSGGQDVYKVIYDIAREIPADTDPVNVQPQRWWKSA